MNKLLALNNLRRFVDSRALSIRITAEGKDVPKKKTFENRITLIGVDNTLTITDLKNAQNLSERRELKLVKVQDVDSKTRRPVYRLLTNAQYHEEELAKRKEKQVARDNVVKGQKLLTLTTKIADHDVMTNINKIKKLLDKQFEVKVIITGTEGQDNQNFERIYMVMEQNLKPFGKILQKVNKGSSLKFQLFPLKNVSTQGENNSKGNENGNDKGPL